MGKKQNIIEEGLVAVAEGITGLAASNRKELALSLGGLLQKVRGGHFISKLGDEWESFRKKGRIADDYLEAEQGSVCLHEILDFLDKDIPDQHRFELLKRIFLVAGINHKANPNDILPQQYMRLCRSLSSGEAIVLGTIFHEATEEVWWKSESNLGNWSVQISKRSGMEHIELLNQHVNGLVDKGLLINTSPDSIEFSNRVNRLGSCAGEHCMLSGLGWGLCEYLSVYETT